MSLQYESSLIEAFSIVSVSCQAENARKKWQEPPLTSPSISNQPPRSQPVLRRSSEVMAQQDDGWPLGLRLLNSRVGLLENPDFSGSVSFNTLPTGSPSSFTDSSNLDSESTGSFFHDKSITLGSLIGVSSIVELSRRSSRGNTRSSLGDKKNYLKSKPWLFSLCCKLSTDAVSVSATHTTSLAHFLEAERRSAAANCRRNQLSLSAMMHGRPNNLVTS